jgi:hypothetical protein
VREIRVGRSGRKHGIGLARILQALRSAGEPEILGDKLFYVGRDDAGTELEIIVIADPATRSRFLVIHAMPTSWKPERERADE